jgi:CorA-like Mg2+ transporter protein
MQIPSEVPRHLGGHLAVVLERRAQDQHLGVGAPQQPDEVVAAEPRARVVGGRHDDPVEVLVVEDPPQRIAIGAAAHDPRVDGDDGAMARCSMVSSSDEIEDDVFDITTDASRRIYELTREVINFQRATTPLPGMLLQNILNVNLTLETKALSEVSNAQNEEVKTISAWAAILFAPTLVGTVYGMNFDHMPELHWQVGYPFAIVLMFMVSLTLYFVFKRRGWI